MSREPWPDVDGADDAQRLLAAVPPLAPSDTRRERVFDRLQDRATRRRPARVWLVAVLACAAGAAAFGALSRYVLRPRSPTVAPRSVGSSPTHTGPVGALPVAPPAGVPPMPPATAALPTAPPVAAPPKIAPLPVAPRAPVAGTRLPAKVAAAPSIPTAAGPRTPPATTPEPPVASPPPVAAPEPPVAPPPPVAAPQVAAPAHPRHR